MANLKVVKPGAEPTEVSFGEAVDDLLRMIAADRPVTVFVAYVPARTQKLRIVSIPDCPVTQRGYVEVCYDILTAERAD